MPHLDPCVVFIPITSIRTLQLDRAEIWYGASEKRKGMMGDAYGEAFIAYLTMYDEDGKTLQSSRMISKDGKRMQEGVRMEFERRVVEPLARC
jgi:hypothetical protein